MAILTKDNIMETMSFSDFMEAKIKNEDANEFNTAAAEAKKDGKKFFTIGGKKYPVTIDKDDAEDVTDGINEARKTRNLSPTETKNRDKVMKVIEGNNLGRIQGWDLAPKGESGWFLTFKGNNIKEISLDILKSLSKLKILKIINKTPKTMIVNIPEMA